MSVGTGTAIAIALGGTSVLNAVLGHKAAGKASEQLQEGVREARAYGEPLYQQARDLAAQQHAAGQGQLAPYTQAGAGGIGALQQFLGVPTPPGARAATTASMAPPPPPPAPTMTPLSNVGRGAPSLEQVGRSVGAAVSGAPQSATQSSYVTLRAPTGETQAVPADQAAFFVARGATQV